MRRLWATDAEETHTLQAMRPRETDEPTLPKAGHLSLLAPSRFPVALLGGEGWVGGEAAVANGGDLKTRELSRAGGSCARPLLEERSGSYQSDIGQLTVFEAR